MIIFVVWSAILALGGLLIFMNLNEYLGVLGQSSAVLELIFNVITFLGDTIVAILILAVVFYLHEKKSALQVGVLILTNSYLNSTLKDTFRDPRPVTNQTAYFPSESYGLPSGHTQNSVVTYGYLGNEFQDSGPKYLIPLIAILLMALIGASRVIVGVHDVQDVMVGALVGIPFLIVFIYLLPYVSDQILKLNQTLKYVLAVVIPLVMFIIPVLIFPTTLSDIGMTCGGLLGLCVGYMLEEKFVELDEEVSFGKKIIRLMITVVILLLLYVIMDLIDLSSLSIILDQTLSFIKYAVLALIAIFLAPLLFKAINL